MSACLRACSSRSGRAGARSTCRSRSRSASSPSAAMLADAGRLQLPNLALVMYEGATSFPLLAIPLFILAGAIMNSSSHLAAADGLLHRAGRLHPRRARACEHRARRCSSPRSRARRSPTSPPPARSSCPAMKQARLFARVHRGGHVVLGDARDHHPAVDPDDPLRRDGGDSRSCSCSSPASSRACSAASG